MVALRIFVISGEATPKVRNMVPDGESRSIGGLSGSSGSSADQMYLAFQILYMFKITLIKIILSFIFHK